MSKQKIKEYFSKFTKPVKDNPKLFYGLIIGGILLVFAVAAIVGIVISKRSNNDEVNEDEYDINIDEYRDGEEEGEYEEEEPATIARRLDGLIVAREEANKIPVCVMIENLASADVRPQAGLSAASVVYELIVEGGITRLMAIYAGGEADPVGPVRSARDTYLEFAAEIDCMYTHAGGSYTAMLALQEKDYKDLDGLRESKYFWRVSDRSNPHNFFTKTDNLYEAVTIGHSWYEEPTYDSWQFKDASEQRLSEGDEDYVSEVNINYGWSYDVSYKYNSDSVYYERYNGGVEHTDVNTGEVLTTNNIIIQKVPEGWFIEGKGRINFDVTGEGEVYIFREGQKIEGVWKKESRLSRTKFYYGNGEEIELLRGNSWVEIVPENITFDWK